MNLFVQQFVVLLWKCGILRKRHYISTAFEVILPLVLSTLVATLFAVLSHTERGHDGPGGSMNNDRESQVSQYHKAAMMKEPLFSYRDLVRIGFDGAIFFTPDNDETRNFTNEMSNVMEEAMRKYGRVSYQMRPIFVGFKTEGQLVAYYMNNTKNHIRSDIVGLIFDGSPTKDLRYTIRAPGYNLEDPKRMYPQKSRPGPRWYSDYANRFSFIQVWVNEAYLNLVVKDESNYTRHETEDLVALRFPYPAYYDRPQAASTVVDVIPMIVIFGFIVTAPIIVKRLADEKVSRCREMYRLMGLSDWVFWGSTFANYMLVNALQSLILTILYTCKFNGVIGLVNYANPVLIFFCFLFYGMAFIMQSMLLSVPFNRPVVGVIVTVILWLVTYVVPVSFVDPTFGPNVDIRETNNRRILSCLLPNMALYFVFRIVGQREIYGTGFNFATLFEEVPAFGTLSLGLVLLMLILTSILSGILIWYVEAVWPWQFGVPKPFYFPLLPSYWCAGKTKVFVNDEDSHGNPKFFERRMSSSEVAVSISHLRKEFGIGFMKKVAISDANLEINRGQITVLLGHNGAGKTTMMNIITGMFPPTSGTVNVEGYDIVSQTKEARRSMSLCPQHNVLYDELTVEEHLKLFAAIKGTPWSTLDSEVEKCVSQLNFADKKRTPSASLSGGMKRKLNLGIALIGDSKIVILDEPTSGMDPDARRTVWDLLQAIRNQKTILITTHFMEEADALGDRIAIMATGEVKCFGTPMFLKATFGNGYQLRIAKGEFFIKDKLDSCIYTYFPNASVVTDVDSEVVYRLDDQNRHDTMQVKNSSTALPEFFETFENKKQEFGVDSCGLSVTTIEDVFLGVNSMEAADGSDLPVNDEARICVTDPAGDTSTVEFGDTPVVKLTGFAMVLQQLKGLLLKRYHFAKRYLPMVIFQLIIPALMFLLVLYIDMRAKEVELGTTKLRFSLKEMYGKTTAFYQTFESVEGFHNNYKLAAEEEGAQVNIVASSVDLNDVLVNASESMTINEYIQTFLIGASVNSSNNSTTRNYSAWYSSEALHSLPASINVLYNAILKEVTSNSKSHSISASAEAFPTPDTSYQLGFIMKELLIMIWSVIVPMTVPFLAASYVLFPIHERESKAKLLQLMSGVHPTLFWFANLLFDLCTHLMCCYVIFSIFAIMDRHGIFIAHFESASALFSLLFLFGISCIPMAYVASFVFKSSSTGFAVLVIVYLIFGVILSIVDRVLKFSISTKKYNIFQWIVRISPLMSLTKGVIKLYDSGSTASLCDNVSAEVLEVKCQTVIEGEAIFGCCLDKCKPDKCYEWKNPFQWGDDGIVEELLMIVIDSVLFCLLLALLESNLRKFCHWMTFGKSQASNNVDLNSFKDSDVEDERRRVEGMWGNAETPLDSLVVANLTKKFGNFVAVNNLTFAVHNQECFGLLGVNGAGKTTTFRMLVGDLFPTSGNAYCYGFDIKNTLSEFQQNVGYCPQFDALLSKLTGSEMLYLFGRLRGIPDKQLQTAVKELIIMTDLAKHAEKKTETYSGGTRRKLSLAIALVGSPKLLFLDEPSSGVDPGARRKMWKTLAFIRSHYGCSLILTSHSMDECEALCGRIAIMVNGEFKCLGNFQHLRSKFGQGFTMKIKVKRANLKSEYVESVKKCVSERIPSASLKDLNETVFEYHITDVNTRWSSLFKVMAEINKMLDFEDYTISDTTLEQIFISFARQQRQ